MNVMKAGWDRYCNMDIGEWEPVPKNDLDPGVRLNQKVGCMTPPWAYLVNFFKSEGWPTQYRRGDDSAGYTWDYEITVLSRQQWDHPKGTVKIQILAKRFWTDFRKWNRNSNTDSFKKETNFWRSLQDLGVVMKTKQRFKNKFKTTVCLYYKQIRDRLNEKIAGFVMPRWPT